MGSNWFKLNKIGKNLDQIGSNMIKLVETRSKLTKLVKIRSNMSNLLKLDQNGSNWFVSKFIKPVQTITNLLGLNSF